MIKRFEDEEINAIQNEVENILNTAEFKEMSEAFKRTVAQRLGIKEFEEGGLVLQAKTDFSNEPAEMLLKYEPPEEMQPEYVNIYSYSFW